MFGSEPDSGQIAANIVENKLLKLVSTTVHYTNDSEIIKLLEAITSLAKDGVTYRSQARKISSTAQALEFAQDFIKSKGLADEFNQYCFERDVTNK